MFSGMHRLFMFFVEETETPALSPDPPANTHTHISLPLLKTSLPQAGLTEKPPTSVYRAFRKTTPPAPAEQLCARGL